jgi:large subunit ribosomal protein L9
VSPDFEFSGFGFYGLIGPECIMASNVQLILARDVANLGRVGDLVQVRAGYARNFLFPKGLGLPASPKQVTHFEHQRKVIEHRRRVLKAASEKNAQQVAKLQITLTAKVGEQGKLFGAITSRDIAKALAAEGHIIDHRDVKLDAPIRTIGLHKVDLRLEADVTTQVKIVVAADASSPVEAKAEAEVAEKPLTKADGEPDLEAEEDAIASGVEA